MPAVLAAAGAIVLVVAVGAAAVADTESVADTSPAPSVTVAETTTTSTVAESAIVAVVEHASLIWDTDLIDTTGLCCYADVDDHYDLPDLYAQTNIRVAGIVIDRGWLQRHPDVDVEPPNQPGHATLDAMEAAYSKHIPRFVGIDEAFDENRCNDAPAQTKVLAELVENNAPVVYATAGSVRQLAWTLCAFPEIKESITNVIISGGDGDPDAATEWNEASDPDAFSYVMQSGLSVTWLPAFDGGLWNAGLHGTLAESLAGEILDGVPQVALEQLHVVFQRGNPDAGDISDMLKRKHRRWIGQFISNIDPVSGRITAEPGVFGFQTLDSTIERIVVEDRDRYTEWNKRQQSTDTDGAATTAR